LLSSRKIIKAKKGPSSKAIKLKFFTIGIDLTQMLKAKL